MASGNLKAFVSESELNAQRQRRQEEWEKVRTGDQPQECPEDEYDPRSLYEKLQEQKDKKQSEYDEQFKFKNMIRGIDEEETRFLNNVAERRMKIEAARMTEEKQIISECKETIVNRVIPSSSQLAKPPSQPTEKRVSSGSKRSQAALLAGAVKRKRSDPADDGITSEPPTRLSDSEPQTSTTLESPSSSSDNGHASKAHDTSSSNDDHDESAPATDGNPQCIAILPGIGSYSNSSEDSDSDSSDSDLELIKTVFHKGTRRKKCSDK